MGAYGDAIKFVGKNLASGAISYVGGQAAGHMLNKLLGTDSDADQLKHISSQLTDIQQSINILEKDLNNLTSYLKQELSKIEQEQLYLAWEVIDLDLQESMVKIDIQYNRYIDYTQNPKTTPKDNVRTLVGEILNSNAGAEVSLAEINKLTTDTAGKGVLKLWADMVLPLVKSGVISYEQAIENYINYYTKIVYAQVRAGTLLVEAYNADNDERNAHSAWKKYRKLMLSQEVPFLQNIDKFARQALYQGATWTKDKNAILTYFQYFTATQVYLAGGAYHSHYRPTYEHNTAEELLANAQAMEDSERRIVIWMSATPNMDRTSLPSGLDIGDKAPKTINYKTLELQITHADNSNQTTISPSHSDYMAIYNSEDEEHYIKRFIFSEGVTDGTYQMVDQNGKNGLTPVGGSFQKEIYFQNPNYLNHRLTVGPSRHFNFMEFMPYCDPLYFC